MAPSVLNRPSSRVDALGRLLDVGAGRLEPDRVGDDQLVGVALLLRQRAAGLDALGRVRDGPVECRPTGAEPEGGHHQPRVAEHLLGLHEPLALDAADEPVGVDLDVVEEEGGGVAEPDAVLVLGLAVGEPGEAPVEHEPRRPAGRVGEDRVEVGDAAVGDPLLAPGDAVADDHAVCR